MLKQMRPVVGGDGTNTTPTATTTALAAVQYCIKEIRNYIIRKYSKKNKVSRVYHIFYNISGFRVFGCFAVSWLCFGCFGGSTT